MPGHDSCLVPGCPNRRDRCKWGLFPSTNVSATGENVYEKSRLCGSPLQKKGCENKSAECRAVSFYRLPRDPGMKAVWLATIPPKNTPLTVSSRICSVHFVGGTKVDDSDIPTVFLGEPVGQKLCSGKLAAAEGQPTPQSNSDSDPYVTFEL